MRDDLSPPSNKPPSGKTLKLLLVLVIGLAIALVAIGRFFNIQDIFKIQDTLKNILEWIANLGPLGIIAFILIYILATILFIPGSLLTLGAGVIFGVFIGSICVSVAATLGAVCAFWVGRYLARRWVARQVEGNAKFQAIDEAVAREGWKIVLLTRLSPVLPFNLLNYAFSITQVSLRDYFLASWVGMIPGTIMYVYVGSLAGSLTQLGTEGRSRTLGEQILYGIGLLATIAVTLYVTRLAKKALDKKIS